MKTMKKLHSEDSTITYFAAKGIDPGFIFERFTHANEYCRTFEYYPNKGNGYQVNISAAEFNRSLRKYLIDSSYNLEIVECYFTELFQFCQAVEVIQIIQKIYQTIQQDLLKAEMYELFTLLNEAKEIIGRLFCQIANHKDN